MNEIHTEFHDIVFELFNRILDASNTSNKNNSQLYTVITKAGFSNTKEMLDLFFSDYELELKRIRITEPELINSLFITWNNDKSDPHFAVQNAISKLTTIKLERYLYERLIAILNIIQTIILKKEINFDLFNIIKYSWSKNTTTDNQHYRELELICALFENKGYSIVNSKEKKTIKSVYFVASCLKMAYVNLTNQTRGSIKFVCDEFEKISKLNKNPTDFIKTEVNWVSDFNKSYSTTLSLAWNAFNIKTINDTYNYIKKTSSPKKDKSIFDTNELSKLILKAQKKPHEKSRMDIVILTIKKL